MDNLSIPRGSGIYKITCVPTGKFYIGSSIHLFRRWVEHLSELRCNRHINLHLQRAWNKYGEGSFTFEVIELVMPWSLVDREQYWLNKLKPFSPKGFNIAVRADSASAGRKASPEARAKMSAAAKGRKFSDEHRARISASKKGTVFTEQHRANIGKASKGRKNPCSPETRLKHSKTMKEFYSDPAQRERLAAIHRGEKRSPEIIAKCADAKAQWWIVINPDGIEIEVKGLAKFCRENELDQAAMRRVAIGKDRHHKKWKCRKKDG